MPKLLKYFLYVFMLSLCLSLAIVALKPNWRKSAQDFIFPKTRTVLSTVWGRFSEEHLRLKAVKSQDARGVFVEIFVDEEGKPLALLQTIVTGDPYDGQFNFKGHMSRLVANDVDKDGFDELLVPTFDASMRPNLGVYKYQPDTKEFQKITRDF